MAYLGKKGYTIYKESYSTKELLQIRNDMNVKPYSPHSVAVIEYPIYRESSTKILAGCGRAAPWFISSCHMSHNGTYFNDLPMPLRLDHIQTFYVDYLRTYFSKVCT